MYDRAIFASSGVSTGFTLGALVEWLKSPSAGSGLAFAGSAVTAGISWWMARQADAARAAAEIARIQRETAINLDREEREAKREQDRLDREQERQQRFLDLVLAHKFGDGPDAQNASP